MKKTFLLNLAVASALLLSSTASAKYVEYVPAGGWETRANITYSNAGRSYSETFSRKSFDNVTYQATLLLGYEKQISDKLKASIKEQIAGELSLKSFSFDINGPFKIDLKAEENGIISVRVGGFSIHSTARLEKSWLVQGKATIDTNTVWLNGRYNMLSGSIDNLSIDPSFNVTSNIDIDSVFDLIPGFNAYITNKFEADTEISVISKINSALNSQLTSSNFTVFSLDQAIPDQLFVNEDCEVSYEIEHFGYSARFDYRNCDIGGFIKDKLVDLTSGESISIKVAKQVYSLNNTFETINIHSVDVNISNHLFLKVYDHPTILTRWVSDCNDISCTLEP